MSDFPFFPKSNAIGVKRHDIHDIEKVHDLGIEIEQTLSNYQKTSAVLIESIANKVDVTAEYKDNYNTIINGISKALKDVHTENHNMAQLSIEQPVEGSIKGR